jgi:nucleotide-binding universal stress UspA family protein
MNELTPDALGCALICIGDRARDEKALTFTRAILQALELIPVLLHVHPQRSFAEEGRRRLSDAQETLAMEAADILSIEGVVRSEIVKELNRRRYQLLVIGTSLRETDAYPSPLSKYLANRVKTSVLLIRNPPAKSHCILICTAGQKVSLLAVSWGIRLAKELDARATILHVVSGPPSMYTGLQALEENLPEVLSRDIPLAHHLKATATMAEEAGVQAKLELRHGLVSEEILRSSEMNEHQLVILGAPKPRAIFNQIVLGGIAPEFLSSTLRSTLIVRGGLKKN